jgi:hypothetical protein
MDERTRNMPGTGNGQIGPEMERLMASAEDALTDDMVTRLGGTVSEGLDLLDRINRSGIGDALPTLSALVQSGDLKRVADLARLVASAQDAMSDDIVTRLSETAAGSLDLLDQVNRSGIGRALPAIAQLVQNGDLDRLVGVGRLFAAMQDSLSDDIVNRLALVVTGLASLVDKLSRSDGFLRLIEVLGREEVQSALLEMAEAVTAAKSETKKLGPSHGGMRGLMRLARDPGAQDALRFVALVSRRLQH